MHKRILPLFSFIFIIVILLYGCKATDGTSNNRDHSYVTVSEEGDFMIGDSIYRFIGTNLWYAPILASDGIGGDKERLMYELDSLQALGINNLRILAGAEAPDSLPHHLSPQLQTSPGVYNDTLLIGLDRLIAELEERDMKTVIYLTNAWEWSGGYGSYLQWGGHGVAPVPGIDGYENYVKHVSQFVNDTTAKKMAIDHARFMASRKNTVTGKAYSESPAIMAWQVCNEPRAFSREGRQNLKSWILEMASAIKEADPNHLVSTGSEGKYGCEYDMELWKEIHASPLIDYAIIHLWPTNWGWASRDSVGEHIDRACQLSREYITEHINMLDSIRKLLVIEEFGYPRDGFQFGIDVPTNARDKYYEFILNELLTNKRIGGVNFWGWNGKGRPSGKMWKRGADYLCDPAHESQGMYGVFDCDSTTISVIKRAIQNLNR